MAWLALETIDLGPALNRPVDPARRTDEPHRDRAPGIDGQQVGMQD